MRGLTLKTKSFSKCVSPLPKITERCCGSLHVVRTQTSAWTGCGKVNLSQSQVAPDDWVTNTACFPPFPTQLSHPPPSLESLTLRPAPHKS